VSDRLRVIVIDDEPLARDAVRVLLESDREVEVAGEGTGTDAAALIARTRPDVMFLDIQMPEVDGFDVIRQVGPGAVPAVVFVTAYDRYALRAFDVHALDYLLKPFDDERFRSALERAKDVARSKRRGDIDTRIEQLIEERASKRVRFLIPEREKTVIVEAEDIDWIEAADYYVSLHTGSKSHLLRQPMDQIEKQLDPQRFFRIHRSAIVNVDRVKEIHPLFRGDCALVLADGKQLKLSRSRRRDFEALFEQPRHRR
jgi:two-component system LytT family response regulator